jgi:calpain-15
VWTEVTVDNFFPIQDDAPIFSHSEKDETWVLIMEKCWAKLHGNYAKIDGAFAREPLHDLTGAPSKTYKPDAGKSVHTDKNKHIWKRIKDGEEKDHAMCAGSIFFDDETDEAI